MLIYIGFQGLELYLSVAACQDLLTQLQNFMTDNVSAQSVGRELAELAYRQITGIQMRTEKLNQFSNT